MGTREKEKSQIIKKKERKGKNEKEIKRNKNI